MFKFQETKDYIYKHFFTKELEKEIVDIFWLKFEYHLKRLKSQAYEGENPIFYEAVKYADKDIYELRKGIESLVKKANIINRVDDIEAFKAWDCEHIDFDKLDEDEIIEAFQCEFLGVFEDEEDYAYHEMNESHEIPEHLAYYINSSSYWHDLRDSGYYAHRTGFKECYIYRRNNQ